MASATFGLSLLFVASGCLNFTFAKRTSPVHLVPVGLVERHWSCHPYILLLFFFLSFF